MHSAFFLLVIKRLAQWEVCVRRVSQPWHWGTNVQPGATGATWPLRCPQIPARLLSGKIIEFWTYQPKFIHQWWLLMWYSGGVVTPDQPVSTSVDTLYWWFMTNQGSSSSRIINHTYQPLKPYERHWTANGWSWWFIAPAWLRSSLFEGS